MIEKRKTAKIFRIFLLFLEIFLKKEKFSDFESLEKKREILKK